MIERDDVARLPVPSPCVDLKNNFGILMRGRATDVTMRKEVRIHRAFDFLGSVSMTAFITVKIPVERAYARE